MIRCSVCNGIVNKDLESPNQFFCSKWCEDEFKDSESNEETKR